MVIHSRAISTFLGIVGLLSGFAEFSYAEKPSTPIELGAINWSRDFDAATAKAKRENKPMLILFQEVPGCATCRNYGRDVLSHPLIREAAENLFVPVAVYNNVEGKDRRVLTSFNEPTWNNPVVRIVDAKRKQLAQRVNRDYSAAGLVAAMVEALRHEKRDVPQYLRLLHEELHARKSGTLEHATIAMHCFWEGEVQLGQLDGVIETQAGWLNKEEVVDVWFDAERVDYKALLAAAKRLQCARRVYSRNKEQLKIASAVVGSNATVNKDASRADGEPKYYLGKSPYRFVPMTPTQACRVNAALRDASVSAETYLSNEQKRLHAAIQKHPQAKWPIAFNTKDFTGAMKKAADIAKKSAATN